VIWRSGMTSTAPVRPQCKHIVVVEDDPLDMEVAMFDLVAAFHPAKITFVHTAGDFLLAAERLRDADIVITEHHVQLGALKDSEEATTAWFEDLAAKFPDMTAPWNHQQGGERLVRWMRRNGFTMPVLFHTDSDAKDLPGDLCEGDPKVFYLKKGTDKPLIQAVWDAL
jgi:hypothetical protein